MNLLNTLIVAALFFAGTVFVHILISRFSTSRNFMTKGLGIGIASTAACGAYLAHTHAFDLAGLYILFAAWLFYLMAFINLLNSVTLKMLASLHRTPKGTMNAQDFTRTFNSADGLQTRIAMLEASNMIQRQGHVFTLTPKAKFLLFVVHRVKAILSID